MRGGDGVLAVTVDDNGIGAAEEATSHLGWRGMRERVTALGGRLDIERAPAGGVRIAATIPAGAAA